MKIASFFKFAAMSVIATTMMMGAASCSDDDDDKGETTPSLFVPEKIVSSDNETFTFFYDEELRISKLVFDEDGSGELYNFKYDDQGRITKISNDWGSIEYDDNIAYTYSGNTVSVSLTEQGYLQYTSVYTLNNDGLATGSVRSSGYDDSEINVTYKYDNNDRLVDRLNMGDYSMKVTYNNDVNGICKDINMSKFMAVSLSDYDDFLDILLTWDKSMTSNQYYEYETTDTFTYTKINSNGYPEVYKKVSSKYGDEITYTITYKEIKK